MQDRRIIVVGAVIAVVLGLLLANYVGLFGEDYGTGLSINTSTQKFEHYANYDHKKDKKFLYTANKEQLNNDVYISSWQPQGKSTTIVTSAKFYFRTYYYSYYGITPWIVLGQYYWKVLYEDPQKQWHILIDGEKNYINRDYVVDLFGQVSGNLPTGYDEIHDLPSSKNIFGDNTWTDLDAPYVGSIPWSEWVYVETPALSFKIKGTHIGAIRAFCVFEYAEHDIVNEWNPWDDTWHTGTLLVSEDWAYLAPGIGRVDVLGTNSIRQDGTTYTEGTNREVPLYVFEEGSTVYLSVDTGYAGAMTGEKGWRLAIYKPTETQPLATWWLDDDLRGYVVSWTIPKGTWTPGGRDENRLEVYLTNTVIDQAEVTFAIVDNISKMPGVPTIETDKPRYMKGETVKLTLTAEANPITQSPIKEFYVEIRYDDPQSPDFDRMRVPAYHVSGLTYRGTTRFTAEQSGELIISAMSWDEAGRYSDKVTVRDIDVEEGYGNYEITVFVNETDGTPISGAKVTIGGQTGYTSTNGKVTFWLKWGTYSITVEKAGYNTHKGKVVVNSDKTIEIILTPSILPPEGWAIYLMIAVAIAVIIYVGVMVYKKYSRR